MPSPRPADRAWLVTALVAIGLAALSLGYRPLFSPDVGFYLNLGRGIAAAGAVPYVDTLTFTRAGAPVLHAPWLFCLVSWWLWSAGGATALIAARLALHLAVAWLLAERTRRRVGRVPMATAGMLLVAAVGASWEYRPHVVSWLFLALVLLLLEEHARRPTRLVWLVPAILAVWVNVHSLFVLGLVVVGIAVVGTLLEERRLDRRLIAVLVASALACLVTPYVRTVVAFPVLQFSILRGGLVTSELVGTAEFMSPFSTSYYTESGRLVLWQPMLFVHLHAALVAVAIVVGRRAWRARDWLLLLAFGFIFVSAVKNHGYFVVATFPAVTAGLSEAARVLRERHPRLRRRLSAGPAAATLIVVALLVTVQVWNGAWYGWQRMPHRFGGGVNEAVLPVRASRFLAQAFDRPHPVLNNWDAGGWLGFATGWPVFIDGRNEVMGEDFYREYLAMKDPARLPAALERYGIRVAVVPFNDLPAWHAWFLDSPSWRLVHRDDRHTVFVHASLAGPRPLGPPEAGDDYPDWTPADAAEAIQRGAELGSSSSWWMRTLLPQYEPQRELWRALLWLRSGEPEAAAGEAIEGLRRSTLPAPELLAVLGHALWDLDRRGPARTALGLALSHGVDDPLARRRVESAPAEQR